MCSSFVGTCPELNIHVLHLTTWNKGIYGSEADIIIYTHKFIVYSDLLKHKYITFFLIVEQQWLKSEN